MGKFWAYAMAVLVMASCAHAPKGRLVKNHDIEDAVTRAKSLYAALEVEAAVAVLENAVATKLYHSSHDQAYELIVEWLLQLRRRKEAQRVASYFLAHHPKSPSSKKIVESMSNNQGLEPHHELSDQSQQELVDEGINEDADLQEVSW